MDFYFTFNVYWIEMIFMVFNIFFLNTVVLYLASIHTFKAQTNLIVFTTLQLQNRLWIRKKKIRNSACYWYSYGLTCMNKLKRQTCETCFVHCVKRKPNKLRKNKSPLWLDRHPVTVAAVYCYVHKLSVFIHRYEIYEISWSDNLLMS